jgi:hypothetical protein
MASTPAQTVLNVGEQTRSAVARESNKGATAILVGLVAFTAYLYLSGRLRGVWNVITGLPPDALPGGITQKGQESPSRAPTRTGRPIEVDHATTIQVNPKPGTRGKGSAVTVIPKTPECYELLLFAYVQAGWLPWEAGQKASEACKDDGIPKPVILS